ncbi:MAG: ATP-binding cassette domain-containing protein [Clostridia bacterium]|nr:ATP-binding cassette domain-containing protein [Clostridia bacterium]
MKICVSKSYGEKCVFENFALEVEEGEILCVLGESGGGKTTLLNILAGLIPYEGEVCGVPKDVAYIFQEPRLLPNLTVEQNLLYAGGRYEFIEEILQKTEILDKRDRRPKELSGGEKQRVAIARAFVSDAPLLLLDEPFSSLDTARKIRLATLFAALWKEKKKTAVFVTHDIEEAWMLANRVVVLKGGRIAADIRVQGDIPRKFGEGLEVKEKLLNVLLG